VRSGVVGLGVRLGRGWGGNAYYEEEGGEETGGLGEVGGHFSGLMGLVYEGRGVWMDVGGCKGIYM